ncbi:HAD-IIA family hydrolase [soil metagenome]
MLSSTSASPAPWIDRGSIILLDWDGCVATQNVPSAGAISFLHRAAGRIAILSNNSTHLPQDIASILADHGVDLPPERILLAGAQTILHLRRSERATLLLASLRMRMFARSVGINLVCQRPDQIVLMRDTAFTYDRLEQVVEAIEQGAKLIVANADRSHPGVGGRLVPETGALLAAIRECVPYVAPEVIGKPGPILFEQACALLGARPENAVMIGDNPETDGKGAMAVGIRSILIGGQTGLTLGDLAESLVV